MMKSVQTQAIAGKVLGTGVVLEGDMSCQRTAAGLYVMRVPAGKRLLNLVAQMTSGWLLIGVDLPTDSSARVIISNLAGTVFTDGDFRYTAILAV